MPISARGALRSANISTAAGAETAWIHRTRLAAEQAVRDRIEIALAGDRFVSADVKWLAERQNFPIAIRALLSFFPPDRREDLIGALYGPAVPSLRLHQMARAIGALPIGRPAPPNVRDFLDRHDGPAARIAFTLAGEGRHWLDMERDERAAVLLRSVVVERTSRTP